MIHATYNDIHECKKGDCPVDSISMRPVNGALKGRQMTRQELIDHLPIGYHGIPVSKSQYTALYELGYVAKSWEEATFEIRPWLATEEAFNEFYGRH